eukprot:Pgem_evm1s14512
MMLTFVLSLLISQSVFTLVNGCRCRCISRDCWPGHREWTILSNSLSSKSVLQKKNLYNPYEVCSDQNLVNTTEYQTVCSVFNHNGQTTRTDYSGYEQTLSELFPGVSQTVSYGSLENLFSVVTPLNNSYSNFKRGWVSIVPTISVNALTENDVVEAVKFAGKHNLRLIIKNTGHDFYGRSVAPIGTDYSLQLWTSLLKQITMGEDNESVTVQAGANWESVYTVVGGVNKMVYGGSCSSVGAAGGFTLGAGQPIFNDKGLAAEHVLRYKVVLADGRVVEASKTENEHLFKALNGGGGGSFGVVLEISYKTFPITPSVNGIFRVDGVVAALPLASEKVIREGKKKIWGAIFEFAYKLRHKENIIGSRTLGNAAICEPKYVSLPTMFELKIDGDEKKKARLEILFSELKEKLSNVTGFFVYSPIALTDIGQFWPTSMEQQNVYYNNMVNWTQIELPEMFSGAKGHWRDPPDVGLAQLTFNFFDQIHIPTTELRSGEELFEKVMQICTEGKTDITILFGKSHTAYNDAGDIVPPVDHSQISITPEYYNMGAVFYPTSGATLLKNMFRAKKNSGHFRNFAEDISSPECLACVETPVWVTPEKVNEPCRIACLNGLNQYLAKQTQSAEDIINTIYKIIPGSDKVKYFNEMSYVEPHWKSTVWGENYNFLRNVKKIVDPKDLFIVHHGVASDEWDPSGNCRV